MNVASKELCEELHRLSGWEDAEKVWCHGKLMFSGRVDTREVHDHFPAYDLGYLLRKLPNIRIGRSTINIWFAKGGISHDKSVMQLGDTPEDAAAKLTIELFKQGVL